jgi:protein OS-9
MVDTEFVLGATVSPIEQLFVSGDEGDAAGESVPMFRELYDGGAPCDVTGKPRRTEVRMRCVTGLAQILSINEPSSCSYVLNVASPQLCRHEAFRPRQESLATIYCVPLDEKVERAAGAEAVVEEAVAKPRGDVTNEEL